MDAPQDLLQRLSQLAVEAGEATMVYFRQQLDAQGQSVRLDAKADDSPLTLADLAAQRVIVAGLRGFEPQLTVVSEEDPDSHLSLRESGAFWLVDPLDGTREFLAGNPQFTVNIALVRNGISQLGVVHVPALACTYAGGAGVGAWRTVPGQVPEPIRVATPPGAGAVMRVVASRSHLDAATRAYIEGLGAVDLVQAGSSLKFCRVAEGAADVYPRMGPTSQWDTAAAQAVLEGAGGEVVDLAGQRLRYGRAELLNPHFIARAAAAQAGSTGPVSQCAR